MKKQHCDDDCISLLRWAIRKKIPVSVSLKTTLQSSVFNSAFLEVDSEQIRITLPSADMIDLRDPIREIFVTFSKSYNTYSFVAKYIDVHTADLGNGDKTPCLFISLPECIEETNRRSCERFYVQQNSEIPVSFCAEPENEDEAEVSFAGRLHDLSLNGIGISVAASENIQFYSNQKYNISILSSSGQEMVFLRARYRYGKEMEQEEIVVLGFQFTITNATVEGAKTLATLNQIVNHIRSSCDTELTLA